MKCYFAGSSNPQEYPYVDACFAASSKEAKAFMWKHSHRISDECDGDYMDMRVKYQKEYNGLVDPSKTEPYLVVSNKTLRQMGWANEGEHYCDCCGLAANGLDKFEVCAICGQCGECGHYDKCEDHYQ